MADIELYKLYNKLYIVITSYNTNVAFMLP